MYDQQVTALIKNVNHRHMNDKRTGRLVRETVVKLEIEFDDNISSGFGGIGSTVCELLRSGVKSAEVDMDISVYAKFYDDNSDINITVSGHGAAKVTRSDVEYELPTLSVQWKFITNHENTFWFIDRLGNTIQFEAQTKQTRMDI